MVLQPLTLSVCKVSLKLILGVPAKEFIWQYGTQGIQMTVDNSRQNPGRDISLNHTQHRVLPILVRKL